MLTITRKTKFDAAHFLPYYNGKCHQLHGHTYHLEVTVTGKVEDDTLSPKCGMICDFKDIDRLVDEYVIHPLDHTVLNDFPLPNPTAEIMVEKIAEILGERFSDCLGVELVRLRLWETDDSYVTWECD